METYILGQKLLSSKFLKSKLRKRLDPAPLLSEMPLKPCCTAAFLGGFYLSESTLSLSKTELALDCALQNVMSPYRMRDQDPDRFHNLLNLGRRLLI